MAAASSDVWEVMSTARKIRRPPSCCSVGRSSRRCRTSLLAARAQGLGACLTSWASYGGEQLLRDMVAVPDDWMLAGHIVVGWPKGKHGPVRRRPLAAAVNFDRGTSRHTRIDTVNQEMRWPCGSTC